MKQGIIKAVVGLLCFSGTLALSAPDGRAATGNVYFGGDVTNNNACVVILRQNGTMMPNANATQLSSRLPGGQIGIADVYSIWRYYVTVDAPPYFPSSPSGAATWGLSSPPS